MESLMIKQKSNVWPHSPSGVQTRHFALQSRLSLQCFRAERSIFLPTTVRSSPPPHCEWSQPGKLSSAPAGAPLACVFCLESTGAGEFRRGRIALFGRTQTRRRLACLCQRQWSVHVYLPHGQPSTQLSHSFSFSDLWTRRHARASTWMWPRQSGNPTTFNSSCVYSGSARRRPFKLSYFLLLLTGPS